jgi:peptide/nickel transport system ATP-binding protein
MHWIRDPGSRSEVEKLLDVEDLHVHFHTLAGRAKAVNGISFDIHRGETLGVVGESGCGKSVSAMALLRLIPIPPGELVNGQAIFEGRDLFRLSLKEMREVRGNRISMIFQEPMTSLNPVFTVGNQIVESVCLHQKLQSRKAREKAVDMLDLVGIPDPRRRIQDYPHQLSGGMRQRVMIAMALSCNPSLLIADEPTTALDVTVQAQILDLMLDLQAKSNMGIIMITHNLGVIAETANRVIVMYCGQIVESADVRSVFHNPLHPYTQQLLLSIPQLNADRHRLREIPGMVPNLYPLPKGCDFHPRCYWKNDSRDCSSRRPALVEVESGHFVACERVASRSS